MRKKYTIHKKRKYTKKNKIKKSKNKIKYTKKKYKKKIKIKTKRKQRGGGENEDEDEEYDNYNTYDQEELIDILRERDNQLEQAAELIQRFGAKNEELELQLNKEGIDSDNLSENLEEADYRKQELEDEREKLNEDIEARQADLEREKQELEREKEELEREKKLIAEKEERLNVPDDTEEKEMCDGVREINETLKSELDTLKGEHNNLEGKYKGEKEQWEKRKTELTKQITKQNGELKDLKLEIAQKSGLPDENEKLKKMLNDNKKHYESILIKKDNELNECHSELERFEVGDTGPSLADELGLGNQLADNPSNEEMRNLESENNRLKSELERLVDEGEQTREKIRELATI